MTDTQKYILIVDDDEIQLSSIKPRLESAGFRVETSTSGEDALLMMKNRSFDIVLLDIRMPEVDGIEVLQKISAEYSSTEVIMMTGFADFMTAVECLKYGAKDYLVKPIHPTELVTRINTLLRERELRKSLRELQDNIPSDAAYRLLNAMNDIALVTGHLAEGFSGSVSKEQSLMLNYVRSVSRYNINILRALSGMTDNKGQEPARSRTLTDIAPLIDGVCARYEILSRPKGLKIYRAISRPLPYIMCESADITQAFNSLMAFTMEHSDSGDTISISASMRSDADRPQGEVIISVKNSGMNLPDNRIAKLLDLKENGKDLLTCGIDSAEIGLAVSKMIIEKHNGYFKLNSNTDGEKYFVVALPSAG